MVLVSVILFYLSDPQCVLDAGLKNRQPSHVFALLQRVGIGCDGPHFSHLKHNTFAYKAQSNDTGSFKMSEAMKVKLTLANRPTSKQSCRFSLSVFEAVMGLKEKKQIIGVVKNLIKWIKKKAYRCF